MRAVGEDLATRVSRSPTGPKAAPPDSVPDCDGKPLKWRYRRRSVGRELLDGELERRPRRPASHPRLGARPKRRTMSTLGHRRRLQQVYIRKPPTNWTGFLPCAMI
jgi:hypothetical protein